MVRGVAIPPNLNQHIKRDEDKNQNAEIPQRLTPKLVSWFSQ